MKISQIFVIILALALVVGIIILPNKPNEVVNKTDESNTKINEAIRLVNGSQPMQGITMLKDILEEDSTNTDAHWHLGHFSIQSKQYEKAVFRFNKVIETGVEKYPQAYLYLGDVYASMGNYPMALRNFEDYKSTDNYNSLNINGADSILIKDIEQTIQELKNKLN